MKKVILAGALGIAAFTGSNIPGLDSITASAAVQEFNTTVEGKVIEVQSKYFIIESKELNESVTIYTDFQANAKPGEYVKVNSNGPLLQNAFTTSLTANSVEHFELAPGNYEQYTVGHVSEVSSNELLVTYIDNNGNPEDLRVPLKNTHNFKVNDLVKVESDFWARSIPPIAVNANVEKVKTQINDYSTSTESLEKEGTTLKPGMYEKEDGQPNFVIGEITKIDKDYTDYVAVKYPSKNGKNDVVYVDLTQGQQFNIGDRVRVDFHDGSNFHGMDKTTYDHIQKINDKIKQNTNKEQWVWS
ncbi:MULTISPECIES: hypothetical protein [Bacillus]|uniref:hypothetical protein n=1 Tax=Bacillus TaxID=1386 RepID=UPI0003301D8E|nr:hypothetical protein [Bacillus wiedmannii]EOP02127.1 hypothetical protein ICS_05761 [Bacillus cereus BAG2O-3]EOQ16061.1 hypothetical protein KQ3_04975 [Bacillus cereus B5-2]KMP72692.1 ATP synthase F0F1 subunit alpha [Bacillus cereus]RFB22520.1 hypothetical protein DZB85_19495 [Bacillus sp. LB(2018)]RFB44496.1 hypothetical protein DZB83_19220 [Bacillus sp. dmp10]RFB72410.1 hypothetical protein DZB94_16400 [Bacillus sp. AW]